MQLVDLSAMGQANAQRQCYGIGEKKSSFQKVKPLFGHALFSLAL